MNLKVLSWNQFQCIFLNTVPQYKLDLNLLIFLKLFCSTVLPEAWNAHFFISVSSKTLTKTKVLVACEYMYF